jgi:hypothetical protein
VTGAATFVPVATSKGPDPREIVSPRPRAPYNVAMRAPLAVLAVVLCVGLAVVPVFAQVDETPPPYVLLPDKSLLPDNSIVSAETPEASRRPGRDWVGLTRDTALVFGYQVVTVAIFYFLPESASKWDEEDKKDIFSNWWFNVRHPVWDKDNFAVNYIGHPYFGAAYYTRARERGFGEFDSFLYSALASAMYEFGVESLFERPSYQDLIITPVGGALLGWAWEPVRNWIKRKPERAWYDHLGLMATDPIGTLNGVVEKVLGVKSDLRVDVGRDSRIHVQLRMPLN